VNQSQVQESLRGSRDSRLSALELARISLLFLAIAQRMRALLHFLSACFATIEVEERIEVQPRAEPKAPKAIRFRSERFWTPKTALPDRLHLQDGAHIHIVFSSLQGKTRAGMDTLRSVAV
jgi:hypothetical protein